MTPEEYQAAIAAAQRYQASFGPPAPPSFAPTVDNMAAAQSMQDPVMSAAPTMMQAAPPMAQVPTTPEEEAAALYMRAAAEREAQINAAQQPQPGADPLSSFAGSMLPGGQAPDAPAQYVSEDQVVRPAAQMSAQQPQQPEMAQVPQSRGGGGFGMRGLQQQAANDAAAVGQAEEDIQSRYGDAAVNEQMRAENARLMGEERAAVMERQDEALKALGAQQQELIAARRHAADQVAEQARKLDEEASQMSVEDRRTNGQKMMGILAVAFSGLGDAMSALGGLKTDFSGRTLDLVNQQIERDLEMQREAKRSKREDAKGAWTDYERAVQAWGDERLAAEWSRADLERRYARELDAASQAGISEDAALAAQASAQQLMLQADERRANVARAKAAQSAQNLNAARKAAAGPSRMQMLKEQEQGLQNEKLRRELSQSGGGQEIAPGYVGTMSIGDAEKAKIRERIAADAMIQSNVDKLVELSDRVGSGSFSKDDQLEASQLMNAVIAGVNVKRGQGAMGDAEYERVIGMFSDPTKFLKRGDAGNVYRTFGANERAASDAYLQAYGVKRVGGGPSKIRSGFK